MELELVEKKGLEKETSMVEAEKVTGPEIAIRLISQAVEKGMPISTVEKLLEMRDKLQREKARHEFFTALNALQSECPEIQPDQVVRNKDGSIRYHYASLSQILKSVKPLLKKYGFSYHFKTRFEDNAVVVSCVLVHKGGHAESAEFRAPIDTSAHMNPIQQWGASLSYAKRYALCLTLGIVSDEDTDAIVETEELQPHYPEPEHPTTSELMTENQKKLMMALFGKLGMGREERLRLVRRLIGREIESSKELTKEEAHQVIEYLQSLETGGE